MIIRHERLYEQVTRALALRILGGTLSPDSVRNTEAELCRDLGVSRTVLREAVKVLAAKGLVEVRPKTGMRIKPRSEWTLIDRDVMAWQAEIGFSEDYVRNLFQVRLMLEPPTALAAAANATQEDLDGIREAFGRMERELDDFSAYVEDDCDFHDRISRATHNDYLIQINRIILDAVRGAQSLFQRERERGQAKSALDLHKDVCEAILHRDLEWAKSAMTRLIHEAEKDTLRALKNQDQPLDQSAIRTNPASPRKKPKKLTTEVPAVGV
jgi:GntR family transcriptional regulator, galactonate operon transcriptional repressor